MDDEWVAREIKAHGLDLLRSPKAKEDGGGGRGEKTKKPPEAELKMKIQTSKMRIQIANMKIQISTARKREKLKLVDAKILELQRQLDAIEANRSNDKMNELEKQLHAINDCLVQNGLAGLHQEGEEKGAEEPGAAAIVKRDGSRVGRTLDDESRLAQISDDRIIPSLDRYWSDVSVSSDDMSDGIHDYDDDDPSLPSDMPPAPILQRELSDEGRKILQEALSGALGDLPSLGNNTKNEGHSQGGIENQSSREAAAEEKEGDRSEPEESDQEEEMAPKGSQFSLALFLGSRFDGTGADAPRNRSLPAFIYPMREGVPMLMRAVADHGNLLCLHCGSCSLKAEDVLVLMLFCKRLEVHSGDL